MPEFPDIVVYLDALAPRVVGRPLIELRVMSPFALRSVDPPLDVLRGQAVVELRRLGKRIVLVFPHERFLVFHLMIAGRLRWRDPGKKPRMAPRQLLASLEFENGTLFFTEAASRKRASMQLVAGEGALRSIDRGGIEPLEATLDEFRAALGLESHTIKRALTDPRLFSGIGNAYSDEILHLAQLSPMTLTRSLSDQERSRLYEATQTTLTMWVDRLSEELAGAFPDKVTAFREGMRVHGRFGKPCPVCQSPVQRIRYVANECHYCARCQTGGRVLADRSLSRLLKEDWPRSIDDL